MNKINTGYQNLKAIFGENLLLTIMNKDVLSVDLFDTLLLRLVFRPVDIFRIVEEKSNQMGFFEARIDAEINARQTFKSRNVPEVTLEEIYEFLPASYRNLMQDEIDTEIENIVLNPEIEALLKWTAKMQKKIIFLSDMYLPQEVLINIIDKFDFNFEYELILSSSHRTSKADGSSYSLLKSLCESTDSILHIGDSEWSDVLMAKNAGIDAYHYKRPADRLIEELGLTTELNPVILENESLEFSRFIAIATMKRISENWKPIELENFLGVWLLGPISIALLKWLEDDAIIQKQKSVNFLGRDFFALYNLAKQYDYFNGNQFQLHYVNASRRSWVFPFLPDSLSDEIFRDTEEIEVLSFLTMFSMSDDVRDKLARSLVANKVLIVNRDNILDVFSSFPEILDSLREEQNNLAKYWVKVGLLETEPPVLADLGWSGSIVQSLNSYRTEMGLAPAIVRFFGHFASPLSLPIYQGFLLENSEPQDLYMVIHKHIDIFELMFTAQYPQVKRFKEIADSVVPELESLSPIEETRISQQQIVQEHADEFFSIAMKSGVKYFSKSFAQQQVRLACQVLEIKYSEDLKNAKFLTSAFVGQGHQYVKKVEYKPGGKYLDYLQFLVVLLRRRKYKLILLKILIFAKRFLTNRIKAKE